MQSSLDAKNLFPLHKNMKSRDGDAPCPWNEATNNMVSRGMTLEAITRFVACGTFASLGNSKLFGSNVETPIRQSFGICMEFIGPCESNLVDGGQRAFPRFVHAYAKSGDERLSQMCCILLIHPQFSQVWASANLRTWVQLSRGYSQILNPGNPRGP
jgi:hypothetical protein